MVENLLELDGSFFALLGGQIRLPTNISCKRQEISGTRRNRSVFSGRQSGFQAVDCASRVFAIERQRCPNKLPNPLNSTDATGTLSTYSAAGGIDRSNSFSRIWEQLGGLAVRAMYPLML